MKVKQEIDTEKAMRILAKYFMKENLKEYPKPITMLDTTVHIGKNQFRIIAHMSFYGRDEIPVAKELIDNE